MGHCLRQSVRNSEGLAGFADGPATDHRSHGQRGKACAFALPPIAGLVRMRHEEAGRKRPIMATRISAELLARIIEDVGLRIVKCTLCVEGLADYRPNRLLVGRAGNVQVFGKRQYRHPGLDAMIIGPFSVVAAPPAAWWYSRFSVDLANSTAAISAQ